VSSRRAIASAIPATRWRTGGHPRARAGFRLVRFVFIRTGHWGWNSGGGYPTPLNTKLGLATPPEEVFRWSLDPARGIGRNRNGREIALRPFMGVIGVAPDLAGRQSTTPPRPCGGNIDCKELVEGSTLYLPIAVDGALFSIGDGHAVQGDGEVGQVALECPMDVEVELVTRDDMRLTMPRANTPAGWLTFGFHEDLNEAMPMALEGMLDLIVETHGVSRKEALALSSLLVDLRITQVVNRVRGVHAVLPHGALAPRT
jgi:acetamidase/formamidase